ncbi:MULTISPECIES: ABC transporter permease [unclassified Campylobacter]|uniref:ABC transporter permease n=1 Tax=unclassified Campylobacter TaxID=2593542 RepID=UPI0022E9D828|nr:MULTISPECIES: ABC transporter permease [unclassified Campylobacter]MDA3054234.1 ABC transporter permease [Campylobacter sp. VBCF_07 NA4]MDA3060925.1 ABC transporter permease [Campylobacter sp. VBCF_02 NA5]MDA3070438.1 ABC transporter permease [Campylobacter sp. VBCF_08 NA3]
MKVILNFTQIELLRNTLRNAKYFIFGVVGVAWFLGYFIAWIFSHSDSFIDNDHYVDYLFFIAISAAFLGILKGIYDIYGDKELMRKLSRSGLSLYKFFVAKFSVALIIGIFQCYLLTISAKSMLQIPEGVLISTNWLICSFIFICSYAMALVASCLVHNDKMASISLAILLVPQIMLSGLVPYDKLHKAIFLWQSDYERMPPPAIIMPIPVGFEALVTANYKMLIDENGNYQNMNNSLKATIITDEDKSGIFRSHKSAFGVSMWIYDLLLITILCAFYFILAQKIFIFLNTPKFKKSNLKFNKGQI